jgi:hypothetical protein
MRKLTALFLTVTLLALAASCAGGQPPAASPSGAPDPAGETPAPLSTQAFLDGEPDAAAVAGYLRDNAGKLPPEEGDLLLERLILLHQDIAEDLNRRIWETPYQAALYETLGGTLDAAKISEIEHPAVKSDFQRAADGMMTIVRYEETPVFETDWRAVASLKDAFTDGAAALAEYQSRLQSGYYRGEPYNFDLAAADIADTEKLLTGMDRGFVRWQLKQLYYRQAAWFLFGPEGTFIDAFAAGDEDMRRVIEKNAGQYAGTAFGTICLKLLENRGGDMQDLTNFVVDSLLFPPGDPRTVTEETFSQGGASVTVPVLSGIPGGAVLEKINAAVRGMAVSLVRPDGSDQTVQGSVSYPGERYMGFVFRCNWTDSAGSQRYTEAFLTVDLETGDAVTLDDLMGRPFNEYKEALAAMMRGYNPPEDIDKSVMFNLQAEELALMVPSGDTDWPDYYTVTYNGLRRLTDITKLY